MVRRARLERSWQISVEQNALQQVRVTGGPNSFDFGYLLKPANNSTRRTSMAATPTAASVERRGCCIASKSTHSCLTPQRQNLRPVLYNSWEATEFDVDEAGQMALAEKAASIGVERFVMDDGWFGQRKNRPRWPWRLVCEPAKVSRTV